MAEGDPVQTPSGPRQIGDVLVRLHDDGGSFVERLIDLAESWDPEFEITDLDREFLTMCEKEIDRAYRFAKEHGKDVQDWGYRLRDAALAALSAKLPDGVAVEHTRYGAEITETDTSSAVPDARSNYGRGIKG